MLLASLLYLLQPAYAGTNYILDVHYQNDPAQNTKFEGYCEDADESVAVFKSKEDAELDFANYLALNGITITKAVAEKLIVAIGVGGKNTVMRKTLYVESYTIRPTQAEVEAARLTKIKSDIEDANAILSLLNSNIAEATTSLSKLNFDYYNRTLDEESTNIAITKKHTKNNAPALAFGIPMITAGVICASIVAYEDITASNLTGQSIKSLYDGSNQGTHREWSKEAKAEHRALGIAGALLGGTGLTITVLGFTW